MNTVDSAGLTASSSGPLLEIAVRSQCSPTGRGRRENQDNYLVIDGQGQAVFLWREQETRLQLLNWPPGHQRVAVLDGMGGHSLRHLFPRTDGPSKGTGAHDRFFGRIYSFKG